MTADELRDLIRALWDFIEPRVMHRAEGNSRLCGVCGRYTSEGHRVDCCYDQLRAAVVNALKEPK